MQASTEAPAGTVLGSVTLFRTQGPRTEMWLCSRHQVGSRTRFYEQVFLQRGKEPAQQVASRTTDEIFSSEDADQWVLSQVRSKLLSGFTLHEADGNPGPLSELSNTGAQDSKNP